LFRLRAVRLAFLVAVDAVEANAFNMVTVQYVEGVAVDHSHNSSGVVGGTDNSWDEQAASSKNGVLCETNVVTR